MLTIIGILAATGDPTDFTTSMAASSPAGSTQSSCSSSSPACRNSVLSVYSSGLALQALGVPLARSRTVWIDVVFGTSLAVYGVLIATDFLTVLQNFLLWSVYWYDRSSASTSPNSR